METFKSIPGWEKYYEVSDRGRVRSLPRVIKYVYKLGKAKIKMSRTLPGRLLKQQISGRGYFKVSLTKPGLRTQPLIHELVLKTFVGPRPKGLQCCHNNDVKKNNRLSNLRYDTCQSNIDDRERNRKRK